MYLMDGRRVTLSDLIAGGLIKPGDRVRFTRPRVGEKHTAEITEAGRLRLPEGGEYRSPSRAAMVAATMRAVDGWHAWILERTGESLDKLRQRLLDDALSDTGSIAGEKAESVTHVHEWLRDVRTRAEATEAEPQRVTVRYLLAQWGASDRGDQITRIEADLANHGLATRPNFRSVTLETTVSLITAAQEAKAEQETDAQAAEPASAGTTEDEEGDDLYIGLMVGNLDTALRGVESVAPTAGLQEAVTKLRINDYSQLAVLAGKRNLRGAVTWESIAKALLADPAASLAAATVPARDVGYQADLLTVLEDIRKQGFIFVRNESNEVAGIITAADVAGRYRVMADPFILIGDLDRLLRRLIVRGLTIAEVVARCDPSGDRIKSHDDLTMGDYQRVLEDPALWMKVGLPYDRAIFVARLNEIRKVRNDVMHFNPDGVPAGTVTRLNIINGLIREYAV
jgi:CBS domain-containing protein